MALDEFHQKQLISDKQYIDAKKQLEETDKNNSAKRGKATFETALSQAASGNKKLFEINKLYSASKAAMKIPEIAQDSYAFGASFGGPVAGAAMAAIGVAAGIANLNSILSSSYGSKSTPSTSSGSGAAGSVQSAQVEPDELPTVSTNITDISTGLSSNVTITLADGTDLATGLLESQEVAENDGRGDLF